MKKNTGKKKTTYYRQKKASVKSKDTQNEKVKTESRKVTKTKKTNEENDIKFYSLDEVGVNLESLNKPEKKKEVNKKEDALKQELTEEKEAQDVLEKNDEANFNATNSSVNDEHFDDNNIKSIEDAENGREATLKEILERNLENNFGNSDKNESNFDEAANLSNDSSSGEEEAYETTTDLNEANQVDYEKDVTSKNGTSKSKSSFYLSYEKRLVLNIVSIIVLFMLSFVIFLSSISIKSRSSVVYNQSSNLSYDVTLKDNDYYNDDNLSENMQYIASLIDYIDVDFNYYFSASSSFDYTYTYYIESYVSVTDGDDTSNVIYSKTDKLTEPITVANDNSSSFNISQTVRVNYDEYNDLVKEFKSTYGLSADSNLVLSLRLEIKDKQGTVIRSSSASDTTRITIPLTQQLVSIKLNSEDINNSNNINVYQDFSIRNKFTFVLSIIVLLSALASIVRLIIFIKKTTRKKNAYENALAKILREYDRVIVNAKKLPIISGEVIDVKSFNELLDVRDNIEQPIIFYELHKGQKSIFIVKSEVNTYRYILKLPDLEK